MRMTIRPSLVISAIAIAMAMLSCEQPASERVGTSKTVHIVLVGASIGQAWRLGDWPARVHAGCFTAESVAAWQFDKTEAIEELLIRPAVKFRLSRSYVRSWFLPRPRKPDLLILKECSSYFPGDLRTYRESIRRWVAQLEARGVRVMLATVVPVTRARARQSLGKQEALVAFNQWLREVARQQRMPLLDLEAAVRAEGEGSYLRDDLTSGDGTHLNRSAYEILDRTLRMSLDNVAAVESCPSSPGSNP